MVPHLFWPAAVHHHLAGFAHHSAAATPQNPPRRTTRFLLLYHHWLAELSTRSDELLARYGVPHRKGDGIQAES